MTLVVFSSSRLVANSLPRPERREWRRRPRQCEARRVVRRLRGHHVGHLGQITVAGGRRAAVVARKRGPRRPCAGAHSVRGVAGATGADRVVRCASGVDHTASTLLLRGLSAEAPGIRGPAWNISAARRRTCSRLARAHRRLPTVMSTAPQDRPRKFMTDPDDTPHPDTTKPVVQLTYHCCQHIRDAVVAPGHTRRDRGGQAVRGP